MIAAARVSFMFVGGYLHNTKTVGRLIITLSVCWFFCHTMQYINTSVQYTDPSGARVGMPGLALKSCCHADEETVVAAAHSAHYL